MNLPFQVEQEVDEKFKPPFLRFEEGHIKDNTASLAAGRAVFKPQTVVYIRAPGDEKCEVPYVVEKTVCNGLTGKEEKVYPWDTHLKEKRHHGFISQQYYDFCQRSLKHWRETNETLVEGTPINAWAMLSKAEAENLRSLGILSVEMCSQMTEEAMSAYGMGARNLKEKAQNWLNANAEPGKAAEQISILESNLKSVSQRAEEVVTMNSLLQNKIAMLEAMVKGTPLNADASIVDYEMWLDEDLLAEVKKKYHMAHKGWPRATLIAKLKE